jgi:hypothetical protein
MSALQDEEWEPFDAMAEYMTGQLESGAYPNLRALVGEGDPHDQVARWRAIAAEAFAGDRFERGLARLLDGVALKIERQSTSG